MPATSTPRAIEITFTTDWPGGHATGLASTNSIQLPAGSCNSKLYCPGSNPRWRTYSISASINFRSPAISDRTSIPCGRIDPRSDRRRGFDRHEPQPKIFGPERQPAGLGDQFPQIDVERFQQRDQFRQRGQPHVIDRDQPHRRRNVHPTPLIGDRHESGRNF